MVKFQTRLLASTFIFIDVAATCLAWLFAYFLRFHSDFVAFFIPITKGVPDLSRYLLLLPVIAILWPSVLYFHGFASSPASAKITALRPLLEPRGIELNTPDLNAPSFAKLDWDAIVAHAVAEARTTPPKAMVGSSLGALVALAAVVYCKIGNEYFKLDFDPKKVDALLMSKSASADW